MKMRIIRTIRIDKSQSKPTQKSIKSETRIQPLGNKE